MKDISEYLMVIGQHYVIGKLLLMKNNPDIKRYLESISITKKLSEEVISILKNMVDLYNNEQEEEEAVK